MAKILYTDAVADMRGKVNGNVYSKNRYGAYKKIKVSPINRRTTPQQDARSLFSALSQQFRGLTPAQIAAWNSQSAAFPFTDVFGNTRFLSGNALYIRLNANLINTGNSPISDPPASEPIPTITSLNFGLNTTTTQTLAFDPSPTDSNVVFLVYATRPLSPGISAPGKSLYRLVAQVAGGSTTPLDTFARYSAKYGAPVSGQRIFIRLQPINSTTGQGGIPIQTDGITA